MRAFARGRWSAALLSVVCFIGMVATSASADAKESDFGFQFPPDKPVWVKDDRTGACATDHKAAAWINTATPRLQAWIYDKDREAVSGTQVKAQFQWRVGDEIVGAAETPILTIGETGSQFTVTGTFAPFTAGEVIAWRARGVDRSEATGAWSAWCHLRVDLERPAPPTVTSLDYPDDETEHGMVGTPGDFTFHRISEDTVAFRYGFNDSSCSQQVGVGADGTTTVTYLPRQAGTHQLYGEAVDKAGNVSGSCQVLLAFQVAGPSRPVARFPFDDGDGRAAADAAAPGRTAAFEGELTWTRGRVGTPGGTSGMRFDNAAIHATGAAGTGASTPGPVIDTTKAFSVAAWARLDRTGRDATVVSQDGTTVPGFSLGYVESVGRWVFRMPTADGDQATWVTAASQDGPVVGAWTHLMGTYDPAAKTVALYVNGVPQSTASGALGGWNALGGLRIGHAKTSGGLGEEWPGAIDELRVYDRVLNDRPLVPDDPSTRELWKMVNRPYQAQALYSLHTPDEFLPLTGTDVPDSTDNALAATLSGDPAQVWTAFNPRDISPAAHLNGSTDHIAGSGPAIRTDQAFTVAATVQAAAFDTSADPGRWGTFLSQDGEFTSGFSLQYAVKEDGLPYWALAVSRSDANGTAVTRVYSRDRAQLADWTEVAAGYDPIDRKITLWIDGINQGFVTLDQPLSWNAGGPVQVGRAKLDGTDGQYWNGDVDNIHLYQGLLTDSGVSQVGRGFLPAQGDF